LCRLIIVFKSSKVVCGGCDFFVKTQFVNENPGAFKERGITGIYFRQKNPLLVDKNIPIDE
jgi:hypothetical protein